MARHLFADKSEDFIRTQEQSQLASIDQMRGSNVASLAAMEQTRMVVHTLAQNNDPKFQIPRVSSSIPNNSPSINQDHFREVTMTAVITFMFLLFMYVVIVKID